MVIHIHVGMMGTGIIINWVLYKLKGWYAYGIKRNMVCTSRYALLFVRSGPLPFTIVTFSKAFCVFTPVPVYAYVSECIADEINFSFFRTINMKKQFIILILPISVTLPLYKTKLYKH